MNNKNHLSNEEIYEALMESERTLRQVIDLVPNLIFAKDKNGKFILVNKAVAKVYGKKVEDLIDRHEGDFTRYEEESRHFRKDDLEVINSGKAKFIPEETITDYRGNLRYIQTTKIPFLAGQKPAILGVSVDITDIKQIQNRLETSRNFLNRIINTVPDPIFVKDENHKWIILNDAFCEFMGYSREELIGKSDYDFFPEHEAKVFWDKDDLVFKNDIEDENEEYFTDSSGNLHVILTKKAVLKDSMTGKKILVGVIRDITDRKKSENDLYAEKEQLSVTLESIGDCVITTDAEGNIALMNRVAENLTGWSHEEASLLPIEKIFNIINQKNLHISTNPVDEVIKSLKIFEFPIHTLLITRNNMEKIITGSAAPILDKK
jgi:PAS domain S-box-containing protein